jgi:hypothetical protein
MVWNIGPINEYEAQSAIIPLLGIIIRKENKLQQQCCLIFISRHVATPKESLTLAGDKMCCL